MGTTSVAQAKPDQARPVADPPLYIVTTRIVSGSRIRVDEAMVGSIAGWYYDPNDEAIYRYWDGEAWTDDCSDVFPAGNSDVGAN